MMESPDLLNRLMLARNGINEFAEDLAGWRLPAPGTNGNPVAFARRLIELLDIIVRAIQESGIADARGMLMPLIGAKQELSKVGRAPGSIEHEDADRAAAVITESWLPSIERVCATLSAELVILRGSPKAPAKSVANTKSKPLGALPRSSDSPPANLLAALAKQAQMLIGLLWAVGEVPKSELWPKVWPKRAACAPNEETIATAVRRANVQLIDARDSCGGPLFHIVNRSAHLELTQSE